MNYHQKAKSLLDSIKCKPLSEEERIQQTIALASWMLKEAKSIETPAEKHFQKEIGRMIKDPNGKLFVAEMTDQCFRSIDPKRVVDQLLFILDHLGIPKFLNFRKKVSLSFFKLFGRLFPSLFAPFAKEMVRQETSHVILPGEAKPLTKHIERREKEGIQVNLNRIGEAILGEDEAENRLRMYLSDLANPKVDYISVKISTLCSQLNLLAWDNTLELLAKRLRTLYRAAMDEANESEKFVNLDMEEYRDLPLTVALFKKVLSEDEFFMHSAGIVLQSYLPDSFPIQQELTEWAIERVAKGGAPIKIRLVKGANLAMEKVEASLRNWPQAPYTLKSDTDANFKKMIDYGFQNERLHAVRLGIGSHNLFDIAYCLILKNERDLTKGITFEMLEGMAGSLKQVVQELSSGLLLYCPAAEKEQFQNAVAYLVRRLDENTAPENFLSSSFSLTPDSKEWLEQAQFFTKSCKKKESVYNTPRRSQNRYESPNRACACFDNDPDTDWTLANNRKWAADLLQKWFQTPLPAIPIVVDGEALYMEEKGFGYDPSFPEKEAYEFSLASFKEVDRALESAKIAQEKWAARSLADRSKVLRAVAVALKGKRGSLIGAMCKDSGKNILEADVEVSEAIDFAEYYRLNAEEWHHLSDIKWHPKGPVVVTPPWNFPCSIPAGGILAALAAGNAVLFKPAPEAVLVGYELAKILWEAGIDKKLLQFIPCSDEPTGSKLIRDPRVGVVVLTGATATAKLFLKLNPHLDLMAETGGKNAIIVTSLADRDLAIKDIVQSAFGYSGQKCSACSLVILEREVFEDKAFLKALKDAAKSLKVGTPWDPASKVTPMIKEPGEVLKRGLTTLELGESWLLEPVQHNNLLWSPGIKLGVKEGSFMHCTELFGPVLGVMCAENLTHAIELANGTPYGLTSGLQSLDRREIDLWMKTIVCGNAYINRGITGAIVERQPFGGTKESSFGKGAKAGGPNYLTQLMTAAQEGLPAGVGILSEKLKTLIEKNGLSAIEKEALKESLSNYVYYMENYFRLAHDPMRILGQDNLLMYLPHELVTLRLSEGDSKTDALKVIGACLITNTPLEISGPKTLVDKLPSEEFFVESEEEMLKRIKARPINRVRVFHRPSDNLAEGLAELACRVHVGPVLANGRLELLNYLREVVFSNDYHRYGYLGEREQERRKSEDSCCQK